MDKMAVLSVLQELIDDMMAREMSGDESISAEPEEEMSDDCGEMPMGKKATIIMKGKKEDMEDPLDFIRKMMK